MAELSNHFLLLIFLLFCSGTVSIERGFEVVPNNLIYDSRKEEFHYGLAVPGEKCLSTQDEKGRWSRLVKDRYEPTRSAEAKKLLSNICGRWMGYYCDPATNRCECLGDDRQWETDPEQGCRALVDTKCDNNVQCVNGAECQRSSPVAKVLDGEEPPSINTTTVSSRRKRDEDGEEKVRKPRLFDDPGEPGVCVCIYPGFRNCSREKEMAYNVNSGNKIQPGRISCFIILLLRTFKCILKGI